MENVAVNSQIIYADQSLTTETALQDIYDGERYLAVPLVSGDVQQFRARIPFSISGLLNGGFKFGIIGPDDPEYFECSMEVVNLVTGVLVNNYRVSAYGVIGNSALSVAGNYEARIQGSIFNGNNDGTLRLQFAQNSSNGNTITAKRGSSIFSMNG